MLTDIDRQELKEKIIVELKLCVGPQRAITAADLFRAVTNDPIIPWRRYDQTRVIRSIVKQLRQDGLPIGHRNAALGGYFWAQNDEQLDGTIKYFRDRALSAFSQEAALKKITERELLKQYEMEFETNTTELKETA